MLTHAYTNDIQRGGLGEIVRIEQIEIADHILDKIEAKHGVQFHEVEEACLSHRPYVRRARAGLIQVHARTVGGRYLAVLLAWVSGSTWRVVSARDMNLQERRAYARQAKK